jgi:hypothetical protein
MEEGKSVIYTRLISGPNKADDTCGKTTAGTMEQGSTVSVVRFEVVTAVFMKMHIFWDVTLCHWMSNSQCFKGV